MGGRKMLSWEARLEGKCGEIPKYCTVERVQLKSHHQNFPEIFITFDEIQTHQQKFLKNRFYMF